jgi:hypothetical protein
MKTNPDPTSDRRHRATVAAAAAAAALPLALALACAADDDDPAGVRAGSDGSAACSVSPGEYACNGPNCPVQRDFVIHCPSLDRVDKLQIGIDEGRVWGSFSWPVGGVQAFRSNGNHLALIAGLPGSSFAGQASDGTAYRYDRSANYWASNGNGWEQFEATGLPSNFMVNYGFRVRPDASGGLYAEFLTGSEESGNVRLGRWVDGAWVSTSMGSWDPNTYDIYAGVDGWDREHALIVTGDWEPSPQLLLHFSHWDSTPIGAPGRLGRVAPPPRPTLDLSAAPIALLRPLADGLALLTAVDGDDWSEHKLAETQPLAGLCPNAYVANTDECPPCAATGVGVEFEAYQLARTSGGGLWAAWLSVEASVTTEYTATPFGARWRCVGIPSGDASGVLRLVELAADATILRELELPFAELGFVPAGLSGRRELAIAAFGDRVALLLPSHHGPGAGVTMRVLVIDTTKID